MSRSRIALGLLAVVAGWAAWQRCTGLDPAGLFIDDVWLALACSELGPSALHDLHMPVPIGFAFLTALAAPLGQDPEWPLQLLPFAAGLVQIPVFYWLVRSLTGNAWVALLAASNPLTIE